MTITHHVGPALDVVRTLPDASVDLAACSPPFNDGEALIVLADWIDQQ